jgi:hypothetical protein
MAPAPEPWDPNTLEWEALPNLAEGHTQKAGQVSMAASTDGEIFLSASLPLGTGSRPGASGCTSSSTARGSCSEVRRSKRARAWSAMSRWQSPATAMFTIAIPATSPTYAEPVDGTLDFDTALDSSYSQLAVNAAGQIFCTWRESSVSVAQHVGNEWLPFVGDGDVAAHTSAGTIPDIALTPNGLPVVAWESFDEGDSGVGASRAVVT